MVARGGVLSADISSHERGPSIDVLERRFRHTAIGALMAGWCS